METYSDKYKAVYHSLLQTHRKLFLKRIGEKTLHFIFLLMLPVLFFLVINLLFSIEPLIRTLFVSGIIVWFLFFSFRLIFPLLREVVRPGEVELSRTAKSIGDMDKNVLDALLDYIQIHQDRASSGSPSIKEMALKQLGQRFDHLKFKKVISFKSFTGYIKRIALTALAFVLLLTVFPDSGLLAIKRIVIPWKDFKQPIPIKLVNKTGSRSVLKNDPVKLSGSFEGVVPEKLYLVIEDTLARKNNAEPSVKRIAMEVPVSGEFDHQLDHVRNAFLYRFEAEINQPHFHDRPAVSGSGTITVRERPNIRNLQVKVKPPAYTGLRAELLPPNDGEITALKGSKVSFSLEADKQLSRAFIWFSDSTEIPLGVSGHTAKGEIRITRNLTYKLKILDTDSIDNGEPIEYSIFTLVDEYPFAEIKQPGSDVDLEDNLNLPLFVEIRDDFGFRNLLLKGQVIRQGSTGDTSDFEIKLPYKLLEKGKGFTETMWDLTPFYMIPDDYIQYFVEVKDNDFVSGPKIYRTEVYTVRLPSLLDIMADAEKAQEEQLKDVKDIAEESKEIKEKLEEVNRELKKEMEMNWERKQEVQNQLDRQKKAMEKLADVQKELEDVVRKMENNRVLSPETMDKYFELQEMFQKLASPELKEAMEKLNKALSDADPRQIQKALEKFEFSLEQFEKNIERTYELFKRVQLEQKMDELVSLAEKISEEQEQVNEKLENQQKQKSEEVDQLAEKERNLKEQTESLKSKLGETNEEYRQLMQELSEMLEQAQSYMDEQKIPESMQQMQQQMQKGQQQNAMKSGQDIKAKMDMMQNMLQNARNQMMNMQKEELASDMQKSMRDMLATSFAQENLLNRSQNTHVASSQLNNIAKRQSQIQQSTRQLIKQLIEISNKTFMMSPQMNQVMSNILSSMNKSIGQLEERNPRQAANAQRQAMAGFNQAILSLQNSMQQLSQSSSASGFQEFMEQLQQMAGQQGQLNQQTMNMFQKNQQGRLQPSPDDLARMAAQQEMIKNSMEQLSNEAGNRRDVLGRMDELGKEMEEVIKDLKKQQLDRKVIQRQERILSRMLDAQKSIREKEFSKRREAEREKQVLVKSPPELRRELLQKEDRLRRELIEALQEGYAPEYREFIKLYFETLSRENVNMQ